jgi:hypothetical protein
MPTPTRPTTGGPVESSWGQEVHDQAFLPSAGAWVGAAAAAYNVAIGWNATNDPGGWLVGGAGSAFLQCPADGDGLYLIMARWSIHPGAGANVIVQGDMRIGVAPRTYSVSAYAPANYVSPWQTVIDKLIAGEQIRCVGALPTGAGGQFGVSHIRLVRLGRDWGVA